MAKKTTCDKYRDCTGHTREALVRVANCISGAEADNPTYHWCGRGLSAAAVTSYCSVHTQREEGVSIYLKEYT